MVRVLSRLTDPVLRPTVRSLHGWALAAMISNAVVIATGAAVRLSSSGLGCPDWPACTKSSAVAADSSGQTLLNSWIEFGNRLLNFPLVAIAGLAFIAFFLWHRQQKAAGRAGRTDLVWLSAVLPLGVVAQAVIGGIVVLTKLNPALVSVHFLLSTAIILTSAVVLHARTVALEKARWRDRRTGRARSRRPARGTPAVRIDLRVLAGLLTAVTALMLAAGTVVTGTGPLAGTEIDSHGHLKTVPRFHFSLESVTQLHADIGWFIGALAVALVRRAAVLGRAAADGPPRLGGPGRARPAGDHRLRAVLQPPAGRPGLGARLAVGADLDLRPPAVPVHHRRPPPDWHAIGCSAVVGGGHRA